MTGMNAAPSAQTETLAFGGCGAPPRSGYTPLPAGDYQMEIVESEYGATAKGTGMILKCKAQIVGGEYEGRPFYLNYNLQNDNDQAQEIGQRDFAGLRRATGVLSPDDSEELHFKTFTVTLGVKARKDTGEMENYISQYLFEREDEPPVPHAPSAKATDWRKAA